MKVKLPYWDGRFTVELYDMNKKPMYLPPKKDSTEVPSRSPVDLLPKGAHLNGIIQCNGMWFAGGKFGVTWKLLQACTVLPTRLVGGGTCHVEDDSDDELSLSLSLSLLSLSLSLITITTFLLFCSSKSISMQFIINSII